MLNWNRPTVPKSQALIEKSLDRHFGGRQNRRDKTVSQIVDRVTSELSRLSFVTINTIISYLSRGITDYAVPV